MVVERVFKSLREKLKEVGVMRKYYPEMEGDLYLVAGAIIEEDATKHIETITSDGISEGGAKDALGRLLDVRTKRQTAKLIVDLLGHPESPNQKRDFTELILARIEKLQSGK